ncbi:MAG: methyltransferase domain-containing protein [Myxococcales bacterium]|nr:MAG: methyltransferase domain-containing protein [Myxococcales bacterium]
MSGADALSWKASSTLDAAEFDTLVAPRYILRIGASILDKIEAGSNESILDLACRTGSLTLELLKRLGPKARIIALESDPELLGIARSKAPKETGRRLFFGALSHPDQWRFEEEVFSTIVANLAFDELPSPEEDFRRIYRTLKNGGRIIVTRLCSGSFQEVLDMLRELSHEENNSRLTHRTETIAERYVNKEQFVDFFKALGFEISDVKEHEFSLSFDRPSDLFSDPVVRRVALQEWKWISEVSRDADTLFLNLEQRLKAYFEGQTIPLTLRFITLEAKKPTTPTPDQK